MSRKNAFLIAVLFFVFAVILGSLPLYWQKVSPKIGYQFNGTFYDMVDKPFYLSMMKQGEAGEWSVSNLYTTEIGSDDRTFVYTFYVSLGHISRILNVSVESLFWFLRVILGLLFVFLIFCITKFFSKSDLHWVVMLYFIFFVSGLGYLFPYSISPDLWMPDFVVVSRFFFYPHFLVANILSLIILFSFYKFFVQLSKNYFLLMCISVFLLGFILPYYVIPIIVMFFSLVFLFRKTIKVSFYDLFFFLISSCWVLIFTRFMIVGTVWSEINSIYWLYPPPVIWLISGFGLSFLFFYIGLSLYRKKFFSEFKIFIVWFSVPVLLAYIPISVSFQQRRFLDLMLYLPLSIFASYGVLYIFNKIKTDIVKRILIIVIVLLCSSGIVVALRYYQGAINSDDSRGYFLSFDTLSAFQYIQNSTSLGTVVLTQFYTGEYLPVYTYRKVYLGHAPGTLEWKEKVNQVDRFYSGVMSYQEAYGFLKFNGIGFIYYGEEEKKSIEMSSRFWSANDNFDHIIDCGDNVDNLFLQLGDIVYNSNTVIIYRVK